MTPPIGVVDVVYRREPSVVARSELAQADGFAHIDVLVGTDAPTLALPIGCPTAFPKPVAGWCSTPAPPVDPADTARSWDRTVRWYRDAPGALCEPWAGATVHSLESMLALREEVPGLQFLIDTGHATAWGSDVVELLPYAAHVQLRDAVPGNTQVYPGDGDVDFAAAFEALERLDYRGVVSVEYFDLPEQGWPCEDPRGWAVELRAICTR
ncbi:MAG: sugar phosphate isomerase/epimerase family protein [Acidimicrobiia bacterium]